MLTETRRILKHAIAKGGTTVSNYLNSKGEAGLFQLELLVYGRAGEPCRCGAPSSVWSRPGAAPFSVPSASRSGTAIFDRLPWFTESRISFRLQPRPWNQNYFPVGRRNLAETGFSITIDAQGQTGDAAFSRLPEPVSRRSPADLPERYRYAIKSEVNRMKYLYALLAGLLGALVLALPAAAGEKNVVGWIEKVRIYPGNFVVHAKLDSGAEYSSLDAANLTEFDRDGKRWVRFDLSERDGQEDYHRAAPVAHGHDQAALS